MILDLDQELHRAIRRLCLIHASRDRDLLGSFGIRRARFFVLYHLHREPGLSFAELSDLTGTARASISRMVRSMELEGLIRRQASEDDRRIITLFLTESGQKHYGRIKAAFDKDLESRFAALKPDQKVAAISTCVLVLAALQRSEQEFIDQLSEQHD